MIFLHLQSQEKLGPYKKVFFANFPILDIWNILKYSSLEDFHRCAVSRKFMLNRTRDCANFKPSFVLVICQLARFCISPYFLEPLHFRSFLFHFQFSPNILVSKNILKITQKQPKIVLKKPRNSQKVAKNCP